MWFNLFSFWKSDRPATQCSSSTSQATVRPSLEPLEARDLPSVNPLAAALGAVDNGTVPLNFGFVFAQNGQLTALTQLGTNPMLTPITVTTTHAPGSSTPILDLHIDPIHLNLLGLNVQTSAICLDITAQSGSGDLLGNLLGNVAHLLDSGQSLGSVLNSIGPIGDLLLGLELTQLLNGASNALTAPSSLTNTHTAPQPPGSCDILNLSVGPLNLNLLGLNVALNNCATPPGPVTVDVFATTGPGDLLGNLLCSITHSLDPSGSTSNPLVGRLVDNVLMLI